MPSANVNGFSMHSEDVGSGEPLIFYHGYLNAGNVWDRLVEKLNDSYRCIVLDGRGAGQSASTADGHSIGGYAGDMLALADALGLQRFTAVGFSMGGAVATQAALRAPDRVERLILVGSPIDADHVAPEMMAGMAAFAERVVAGDRAAVDGFVHSITARRDGAPFERLVKTALACSEAHVRGAIQSLAELRPGAALASIQTPTLVVGGAADPFLPATLAAAQTLPNSTLHVFSRVSHGMPWEVPSALARVMEDFLEHGVVTAASLAGS